MYQTTHITMDKTADTDRKNISDKKMDNTTDKEKDKTPCTKMDNR